ncbi:MAG TPA: hypothetical protein VMV69_04920 [Pirellulales bacterium]|nr:hypothetical protein [Pirellulales bacterium]
MTTVAASMDPSAVAGSMRLARTLAAVAVVWLACTASGAAQRAETVYGPWSSRVESQPCRREYWVVNTRQAPACDDLENGFDRLTYSKYDDARGWLRYRREEFVAAMDASLPTTFFVHGSFLNHKWAVRCGWRYYHGVGNGVPAFRLVLWSWPAERIPHRNALDNFRVKMARSERQGYYLAALINQLDPAVPLSLTGHSIGCRSVCAALEGLASGEVAGAPLPPPSFTGRRAIQAGLLVPAFDPRYLWPGGRYGDALSQVDRLLVVYNPRDRMMGVHSRRISPWVLGRYGMPEPQRLGENQYKLLQVSSQNWVGHAHRFSRYANSKNGTSWMRRYFFYQGAPPVGVSGH